MFCTTLRRRPPFAPGIVAVSSNHGLREHQLGTHDLEILFNPNVDSHTGNTTSSRRLRVLLLAPPDMANTKLSQTLDRISHFASLTGGEDVAIIFLLYPSNTANFVSAKDIANGDADIAASMEGMAAYSKLQIELLNNAKLPPLPVLPLAKLEGLSDLITKHITNLTRPRPPRQPTTTTFQLLKLCTASPPMSDQTAYNLTDIFTDLRDLAETCTSVTSLPGSSSPSARAAMQSVDAQFDLTPTTSSQSVGSAAAEKLKRLRVLVGDQVCADVVDFWSEEWMLD